MMNRKSVGLLVAPVLGLLSLLLPILIQPPARHREAPLFPLLSDAVEGVGWPALLLLFTSGCLLGAISTTRAMVLGAATIAPLPIAALLEMVKDSTSHNLFPLEFVMYAFYGLLVVAGASVWRRFHRNRASLGSAGRTA